MCKALSFKTYAADRITEIAHEVHAIRCAVWLCPVDKVYRLNLCILYLDEGLVKTYRVQETRPTRKRAIGALRCQLDAQFGRIPDVATLQIGRTEKAFPQDVSHA
jgi:hypothetical protein